MQATPDASLPAEQRVTLTTEAVARFWSYINKTPTCWLWTGVPNDQGYGQLRIDNIKVYGHRLAYHLMRGPIPAGMQVDHICRVRHCVNPDHLEVVSHRTNTLRGISPHAVNKRKTHCDHGHEYTPANTLWMGRPIRRRCRECRRIRDAARGPRKRGKVT